ncbi:hypothetical protein KC960_04295 [Candidatus Saccharibacteria bacterium]|nr:hypothetical protein [Candidatus Saccharibacteria bacterium]
MNSFSVYLTYIGNNGYNIFIKNNSSDCDFIKIVTGYTEVVGRKRTGNISKSWIISPLKSSDEHVHILQVNRKSMSGKRLWIAFEAVKRNKPHNISVGKFIALSPTPSSFRETIGSNTHFDIKTLQSTESIETLASVHLIAH